MEGSWTDCPGAWIGLRSWPGVGSGWTSPPRGSEKSLLGRGKQWDKGPEADSNCVLGGGEKKGPGLGLEASS